MPGDKKETKKTTKKPEKKPTGSKLFRITKKNGNVIERYNLGDYVKTYEAKGCKVEEV